MKKGIICIIKSFTICMLSMGLTAQPASKPTENDYYRIYTLKIPEEIVLEVGGMAILPDGRIAVSTRRGEVYLIQNPDMKDDSRPVFTKFAEGLHEILGLNYKDGALYAAQRGELTKLTDKDSDGRADVFETVYTWPLSGNYHEFSFGPVIDKAGNFYVSLNIGFDAVKWYLALSKVPWRGWVLKVSPDGKMEPFSSGHRSPAGMFIHPVTGDLFYTENQGDWMGSGGITHVEKGDFVGNPASLVWATRPESPVKITYEQICSLTGMCVELPGSKLNLNMEDLADTGKPMFEVAKRLKGVKTQSVTLPHSLMGQSTSGMLYCSSDINFAPFFDGQIFVGDQSQSKISRVFLEKINGTYQGAAFPFREGFSSGVLRLAFGTNNSMFVGMTSRGWGSTGKELFGLQKLEWTGKVPFEMKNIKAMSDGFEIEFLLPVDKKSASAPSAYKITGFTYKYHAKYGSPIINDKNCLVKAVIISEDGLKARLVVEGLREGYIHEVKAAGVLSIDKMPLLHNVGYYTLKVIPEGEKVKISHEMMHEMMMEKAASSKKTEEVKKVAEKKVIVGPKPSTGVATGKNITTQPSSWVNGPDKTIMLATRPGLMYDQDKITIKAGSKIKLTFSNSDDMQHNVVIVKPGKADEVGEKAVNMGLEGPKIYYVPKSDNVLFHTKLVSPATKETIYFVAPSLPGNYVIVCTYPGHYATMQSILEIR